MSWIANLISGIAKPVSDVITAGTKRKQAKEEGINKIQQAKVDGENSLNLTDAEWEAITAQGNAESWKDEYITVTMTAWIWVAMYGAIYDPKVLAGVQTFLTFCVDNSVRIGWLTGVVATAAVGLKVWRSR
jgi:hypothetical protein